MPTSCVAGFANCNGYAADGCEVNLMTDPSNCGSCGYTCSFFLPVCSNGSCSIF